MPKAKKPREEPAEDATEEEQVAEQKRPPKKRSARGEQKARKRKKSEPQSDAEDAEVEADIVGDEDEERFEGEEDEETQVAEQPEEEEDEEGGVSASDEASKRKKRFVRARKARLVGDRNLAKAAGYSDRYEDDVFGSAGLDGQACLLSIADAKRLTRFVPATPGATTYGLDEFSKRHAIFKKGMPEAAARETQVNADLVMRFALNEATLRTVDIGKKTITASMMQTVLRDAANNMLFTAVFPPLGLVRHGQNQGLLRATEADAAKKAAEKADANKAKKMVADYAKAEAERLAARSEKIKAAAEKRAEAEAEAAA